MDRMVLARHLARGKSNLGKVCSIGQVSLTQHYPLFDVRIVGNRFLRNFGEASQFHRQAGQLQELTLSMVAHQVVAQHQGSHGFDHGHSARKHTGIMATSGG
jgi:hypothetical protein